VLGVLLGTAALLYISFGNAIGYMVSQWSVAEFSHGYLIPVIAIYLVWQRLPLLKAIPGKGSWLGVLVLLAALGLDVIGQLSSLYIVQHIALLLSVVGLVLSLAGWQVLYVLRMPLCILIFMIPVPNIFLNPLSSELQLLSSSLGVWLMRLFGVVVLQNGNVIDLGSYKLEVAEACSGLRYLFPLMTLAFLTACFYRATFWKRAVIFLSSMPITLLTNSLRIASIGVMVDRWGVGMAQGPIHAVQGWMMFMLSTAVLLLEVAFLRRIGRDGGARRSSPFGTEGRFSSLVSRSDAELPSRLAVPGWTAEAVLAAFTLSAIALPSAHLIVPTRSTFDSFPLTVGPWTGTRQAMEQAYLDTLKLNDYLLADYRSGNGGNINLYVAWYDTQTAGDATHSPRACLPGGGWQILDLRRAPLGGIALGGTPLTVNRVVIQNGDQRELVYYWFMQRGRIVTSEYLVKWYLLIDSLTKHRTDGALVRLIIPLPPDTSANSAEGVLQAFTRAISPRLGSYIPG
jgi:exosortase D (VPLPA-CTERM-specific)